MSLRNDHLGYRTEEENADAVDTDGNGQVTVSVRGLRRIESVNDVEVRTEASGYIANVDSVDGNEVTFTIYQGGGAATELASVDGAADVCDVTVVAKGW